jgi:hypothetical protein
MDRKPSPLPMWIRIDGVPSFAACRLAQVIAPGSSGSYHKGRRVLLENLRRGCRHPATLEETKSSSIRHHRFPASTSARGLEGLSPAAEGL